LPPSWKLGRREQIGDHLVLGQRQPSICHFVQEQALRDQRFEDRHAHLGRVELGEVGVLAEHLAHADPAGAGTRPQTLARVTGEPSTLAASLEPRARARVRIQAEECERQDRQPEDDLQDALVLGYEIEHRLARETGTVGEASANFITTGNR
jgi:hypothetical protein